MKDDMEKKIKEMAEGLDIPDSLSPNEIQKKLEQTPKKKKPLFLQRKYFAPALGTILAAALLLIVVPKSLPGSKPTDKQNPITEDLPAETGAFSPISSYSELYQSMTAWQTEYDEAMSNLALRSAVPSDDGAFVEESMTEAAGTPAAKQDSGGGLDHSETNIQVAGVDEADTIKTDGKYIYVMNPERSSIKILETDGTQITPVSEIPVTATASDASGNDYCMEFYVSGDTLVLMVQSWNSTHMAAKEITADDYAYDQSATCVTIYDIADRTNPQLVATNTQDGSYQSSRLTNGYLYTFSYYHAYLPGEDDTAAYIPYVDNQAVPETCIYIPPHVTSTGYLVITSVNLKQPAEITDQTAVVTAPSMFYVSSNHIYVTSSTYGGASESEILKFRYQDGKISPAALGTVPGALNNQFSMDENDGFLRLVTTVYSSDDNKDSMLRFWNPQPESNSLYILDDALNICGSIEDLAKEEQIYSARFMGDTGYFVTFKQVDPLFSVDLSDPYHPQILGELKITGFSSYLHFWDETHLLGIGFEADPETGQTEGVKLSMFDISDPANVTEIDKLVLSDAYHTDAAYNHKAVLINPQKNIIGFQIYGGTASNGSYDYFDEYRTFSYDPSVGFTEEITHRVAKEIYPFYSTPRGLYIGNILYVVENADHVAVYSLEDNQPLTYWKNTGAIKKEEAEDPEIDGALVSMNLLQETYPAGTTEFSLVIHNNTEATINSDMYYQIEYLDQENWTPLPLEFTVNDIAFMTSPGESMEHTINLYPEQYDYQPGQYRVQKTVSANNQSWNLTAEFTIE